MGKIKSIEITNETEAKVLAYVNANYETFKKSGVASIKEYNNHFAIASHINGSPLILGKEIVNA